MTTPAATTSAAVAAAAGDAAAPTADGTRRLMIGYFALVGGFLLFMIAGLLVHGRLTAIQNVTARDNERWASRQADYAELGRLAARLNSPANDVFETNDPAREQQELDRALRAFGSALAASQAELAAEQAVAPPGDQALRLRLRRLRSHLDAIAMAAGAMADQASRILAFFRTGQLDGAGAHMARMDREHAKLADQVAGMGYTVREIQVLGFARAAGLGHRLTLFEYGLAAMTLCFLAGVLGYGATIARRLRRAALDRERALREVRASEARKAAILSSALDAIVTIDAAGNITEFNPAACRTFGWSRQAVIGRELAEVLIPTDQRAAHRAGLGRVLATGEGRVLNQRLTVSALRADGRTVPVELAITAFDDGGRPGFCAYLRDISARLAVERALRDSEARLRSVVDTATDAIITADDHGIIQSWNAAAVRIFGYAPEEAVGRNVAMLAAAPHDARHDAYLRRYRDEGTAHIIGVVRELEARRRDGTAIAVELAVNDVPLERGRMFSAIVRDITARKQAEAELHAAKEAAEAATRAKSLFLANMSHEIRTPMNGVVGMTSLLLDTPLTPEQREFATTIRASADALLTVINDILDFSKIESGQLDLDVHAFDLRECLEGALDVVAPRAAAKGIDLAYHVDPSVPAGLIGDSSRLRQVLVNLLGNGVKFTERGEVTITVGARPAATAGAIEVEFRIADTGIGIPAERMDRLFQSFSQVDPTTTRQYGGTGLGLAISRRLTELMGGRIWVTSTPGQGSVFSFTVVGRATAGSPQRHLGAAPTMLAERPILIVDDSPTNRRILALQTESWGMRPRLAASAAEALREIDAGEPFALALVDLQMPDMDGLALARAIRARGRPLPLVLLSSLGSRIDGGEFAATLTKPVKPSQLFDAILGVLGQHAAAPPPAHRDVHFDRDLAARAPLRILLAEDNPINQKVALRVLGRLGYRADLAINGREVLQALERQAYDVVLLDVQMPVMDGLTAARAIRDRWPERPVRLVAMTANAMEGDRQTCLAAGMDDYLSKPVQWDALATALQRAAAMLGVAAAPLATGADGAA
ncbi:PAS domain S-box protein [bacterium]|nr:PAS domain S-box protein [bacterium]